MFWRIAGNSAVWKRCVQEMMFRLLSCCYIYVAILLKTKKKKEKGRKKQQNEKKKSNFTRFILIDWSLRFTGVYSRCQQRDELTGPRGRDSFWRQHFPPFLFFFLLFMRKKKQRRRRLANACKHPRTTRNGTCGLGVAKVNFFFFPFLSSSRCKYCTTNKHRTWWRRVLRRVLVVAVE